MNSTVTSIRLNQSEAKLLGKAAKFYGLSIPKFIKLAARHEAEDAIDIAIADEAHKRYEADPSSAISWDEFKKEFLKD